MFLCDILIGTPESQVRDSMHSKTGVLDVSDDDGWQSYVMWDADRCARRGKPPRT